jgi:hypothetical protein
MIQESSLYSNLYVETSPVQTTASWTNHIETVRDISLTRGGVEDYVGVGAGIPGSGTITLVDNTATINPGYWIRVKYSTSIIWAGYIQDVNINYTFIDGVGYTVKTLTVLDWAAWIGQFSTTGLDAAWYLAIRQGDINTATGTGGTVVVVNTPGGLPPAPYVFDALPGDRSLADVLDISATTINGYWRSRLEVPTGSGTGLDNLINLYNQYSLSNVALTDGTHTGTPTNLTPYVDIEVGTRTSQVSNNVIVQNLWALNGELNQIDYQASDATSIGTYGSRLASITTNTPVFNFLNTREVNLFPYPSFEDYLNRTEDTNFYYSAEQPALDSAGAWTAYDGDWAYRAFAKTTAVTTVALPLSEVVEVTAGETYYGFAYAAASAGLNSRARFFIQWQNDVQGIISTTYGSYVNHTSLKTWYKTSGSATAPAGAVYARVGLQFSRTTGANIGANSKYWTDGMYFGKENAATWFSGDTPDTSTTLYFWYGTPNQSISQKCTNNLATLATTFLTNNKNAYYSPYRIRLNAQANLTAVVLLDIYNQCYVWFDSHRWTSVVTGISHNISINPDGTTRWMIDLDIRPSAYTI